ncbi:hypothetical protein ACIBEJ_50720 [Nonomuraea sp. NPDC050790]|uniref:hypothetical protein n=1 Tax=Nonomuraea sp. NPDC050790 TaxID=3364371 RepID=UPI0037BBA20B
MSQEALAEKASLSQKTDHSVAASVGAAGAAYTATGVPVEHARDLYRPDRVRLTSTVNARHQATAKPPNACHADTNRHPESAVGGSPFRSPASAEYHP